MMLYELGLANWQWALIFFGVVFVMLLVLLWAIRP